MFEGKYARKIVTIEDLVRAAAGASGDDLKVNLYGHKNIMQGRLRNSGQMAIFEKILQLRD
jgi:hypothetical protein